jgi:hypothetical protein
MTSAQFTSFIKSALRQKSRWWKPVSDTLKRAHVSRGSYKCECCKQVVTASIIVNNKRVKNIYVDHEPPVVDPLTGFTTWDDFISRLFCEVDGLWAICYSCHKKKSFEERAQKTNKKVL